MRDAAQNEGGGAGLGAGLGAGFAVGNQMVNAFSGQDQQQSGRGGQTQAIQMTPCPSAIIPVCLQQSFVLNAVANWK